MKFNIFNRIRARAKNDAGERIESLRFSVPALRVGVLAYGAGQLQTNNTALDGKPVKLYYPPEAVSDEKFLKSLETAPVVVGGHNSTTNEQNKKIDGWAHNVTYDTMKKAAMLDGVVKGAKEVAYIRGNLGSAGFGASAFVDIFDLKVENGLTPDGQEYNAIANDLRATHVALAPHVRDPENKIKVTNAVCVRNTGEMMEVENAKECDHSQKKDLTQGLGDTRNIFCPKCGKHWYKGKEYTKEEWVRAFNSTEDENTMEMTDAQIALMIKNMADEMKEEMQASAKNAEKINGFELKENNTRTGVKYTDQTPASIEIYKNGRLWSTVFRDWSTEDLWAKARRIAKDAE